MATPRQKGFGTEDIFATTDTGYSYVNGVLDHTDAPYSFKAGFRSNLMNGWDLPNFHRRKAAGELLPVTSFDKIDERAIARRPLYRWHETATNDSYERANDQVFNLPGPFAFDDYYPEDLNRFTRAAAAKMNEGIADPLTFIAEWASLRRMFQGLINQFIRQTQKVNTSLADRWLEVRYGWRPLLNDIERFIEAWNANLDGVQRLSERVGDTDKFQSTYLATTLIGSPVTVEVYYKDTVTVSSRGWILADFDKSQYQINPLATAWEIVPFSFLIDWFVNVGSLIQAATFLAKSPNYVASVGCRIEYRREVSSVSILDAGFTGTGDIEGSAFGYKEWREPSAVSLIPSFSVNLDFLKGLDVLALLKQRIRR